MLLFSYLEIITLAQLALAMLSYRSLFSAILASVCASLLYVNLLNVACMYFVPD